MDQPSLFEADTIHFVYTYRRNHKLKFTEKRLDLLTSDGNPVCSIVWIGGKGGPSKQMLIDRLLEAWHKRNTMPFGASYDTPDGQVIYWVENLPF